MNSPVIVHREQIFLPTYLPKDPDKNPMFLEKRVFQGSSGRVYPLPFIDRVSDEPIPRKWESITIENSYISVVILPELGGRIHRAIDKSNGYDFVYFNPVIKPALVGLSGPWISGGIEFNWPQHHRPSTFMPTDVEIQENQDGSIIVWLSEHDPMTRMKGMHGVCLHPDKSYIELKVRIWNRTWSVQTFLWWTNIATRVHEGYQSFFAPDTTFIADHAKRAISTYPLCSDRYYGVDYASRVRNGVPDGERPRQFIPPHCRSPESTANDSSVPNYAPNDLSWYANIPVPTSYMCMDSQGDFFGGYDYKAKSGFLHIANHHIAPGKKQWTWGNHEFGYAWDRNLTESDADGVFAPYIELMAGIYTENQPDFSFLQPGETRLWSQFIYPFRLIGIAHEANEHAAVNLDLRDGAAKIGVAVTADRMNAAIILEADGTAVEKWEADLIPRQPLIVRTMIDPVTLARRMAVRVNTSDGRTLIVCSPPSVRHSGTPPAAVEPPAPEELTTLEELFLAGIHLEQYRHATRMPELYWKEGLRRDPGDSRCNLALGRWLLRRGELEGAERCFRNAIARMTRHNSNPYDGEPFYQLALCLRLQAFAEDASSAATAENPKIARAYGAFYKATWSQAWQASGYHALAEIDASRGDWVTALEHVESSLRVNHENLLARNLKVLALRGLGRETEAANLLSQTLLLDPLDWFARHLRGDRLLCSTQVRLDLVLDYARMGCYRAASNLLEESKPEPQSGTAPMVRYFQAWISNRLGDRDAAHEASGAAASLPLDYCFPARLEEIPILRAAIQANPADARAPFYLGNLLYDRRRHREAIDYWETAVRLEPGNAIAWRNLGIAYFNVLSDREKALQAYETAFHADPGDGRLFFERDQLWKRTGKAAAARLKELELRMDLVFARDDLSIELCALYNQTGRPAEALAILELRHFQPWEGGEGQALGQYSRACLLLGREALARGNAAEAIRYFGKPLEVPTNLGEARHLLANPGDIYFWLGEAQAAADNMVAARKHWTAAATSQGDFQQMSVNRFSEKTFYSAIAWLQLGEKEKAGQLAHDLLDYAADLKRSVAKIDYFATSLPTMLLFEDDLQLRQEITARFLEAQATLALGEEARAKESLLSVLESDPSHAEAADLLGAMSMIHRTVREGSFAIR